MNKKMNGSCQKVFIDGGNLNEERSGGNVRVEKHV